MASYFYISFMPLLLCALFVIQALELIHSKVLTNVTCIGSEREALLKFKQDLTDPSKRLWSWTGEGCCKWEGITCNEKTAHVSKLDLRNPCDDLEKCSLGGKIHIDLSKLEHLKYLDLSFNNFSTQKIPKSLASLKKLEYLNLSNGGFQGDIPHQLSNLSKLRYLDLSNGWWYLDLSGTHGLDTNEWLSPINMLSSLDFLILSQCDLQDVPASLHVNFTSLRLLDLNSLMSHDNKLEGELLKNLSMFCNLQVLSLGINEFTGRISDTKDGALICGQNNLKIVDISSNNFSGHLPNQFENFKDLEFLDLSWNSISGLIPESIGQLSNLEVMDIGHNQLDGVVNELHFANLTNLTVLYFSRNELIINLSTSWVPPFQIQVAFMASCKMGPEFPNWLRTQRKIQALDLSNASISDEVPYWLSDILSNIEVLDLSGNMLRGNISQIIGKKMPFLTQMSLSGSNLTGGIPNSLCMSDLLSFLDLSKNQLSGKLPRCWRKSQAYLNWISLGGNKLKGQIPNSLCYLKELGVLSLRENGLNGVIPKCLSKLHLEILDLSDNQFTVAHLVDIFECTCLSISLLYVRQIQWGNFNNNLLHKNLKNTNALCMSFNRYYLH
ncbi:hypothetical protein EUGRSUZ_G02054 [Eucalyptus grandis]|uniref:Uncharacterized protein n=1 Tax=Eucalyptus grandis TaxID=71139 RepID=A0ACC3K5A7_EUCGR|nr:hypothetical protein EUGRSUZ_G02054 [Eucalyptus grandis]